MTSLYQSGIIGLICAVLVFNYGTISVAGQIIGGSFNRSFLSTGAELLSCFPNPCLNGAQCLTDPVTQEKSCRCSESHTGKLCQHTNPCYTGSQVTRRCLNRGECEVQFPSTSFTSLTVKPYFKCHCPVGFSASLCEIPLPNICDTTPCQNGGTCNLQTLSNYTCSCRHGYRGDRCQLVDFCASGPCKNKAQCTSLDNGYKCTCTAGFQGESCTQDINECTMSSGNICSNGGTCVNTVGSYRCNCLPGFTGQHCQSIYIPCQPSPCRNGGRCYQDKFSRYVQHCDCPAGFSGQFCEINEDNCKNHQCKNGATCMDGINSYSCQCPPTWTGIHCDIDVDECNVTTYGFQPCHNGATCQNRPGSYQCICVNGWEGDNCEANTNDCTSNVCFNGATCHDRVGSFYCECPPGKTGLLCHLDDACYPNPCHAGAECDTNPIDGTHVCSCPPGFEGPDCSKDIDECDIGSTMDQLCEHGGTCRNTIGSYHCDCAVGFTGARCEVNINECASNPCQNDGTCLDERGNYRCVCMPGFDGVNCEKDVNECARHPCQNGGVCRDLVNAFECSCPIGYTGPTCSQLVSECSITPCRNGATCVDPPGGTGRATCLCTQGFKGRFCDKSDAEDMCGSAPCRFGTCVSAGNEWTCQCSAGYAGPSCDQKVSRNEIVQLTTTVAPVQYICPVADCAAKATNGRCDAECNRVECNYDGQECSLRIDPWINCTKKTSAPCWKLFHDGQCDEECNIQECLYDGFDCGIPVGICNPEFDAYCTNNYANGKCDEGCNTPACDYDGLDCDKSEEKLVDGLLLVILKIPPSQFHNHNTSVGFLRRLGRILRTVVTIKKNETDGSEMVSPWSLNGGIAIRPEDVPYSGMTGTAVYLQLDNRKCTTDCFETVDAAAQFLAAAEQRGDLDIGVPVYSVQGAQDRTYAPKPSGDQNNNLWYLILLAVVALAVLVVFGAIRRRRVRAPTWFPDNFKNSTSTNVLTGNGAIDLARDFEDAKKAGHSYDNSRTYNRESTYYDSDNYSEATMEPSTKKKRTGAAPMDNVQWTSNVSPYSGHDFSSTALTPPSHLDGPSNSIDVGAKGPGGILALHLAAMYGNGVDRDEDLPASPYGHVMSSHNPVAEAQVAMALEMIAQSPEQVNEQVGENGETSLHIAARFASTAMAKALLDHGADVTIKDHTGRTALHASIAADSQGVFFLLKNQRKVEWSARTDDGTTPLILAVRVGSNDVVDEILKHDIDINAGDEHNRTALHWAAVVNNAQACKQLLHRQAKVDIQDDAAQTPLFYAAREGNYEAAKELLEFRANPEMVDDMEQTPRDVAQQKGHTALVRLLDSQKDMVHSPPENLQKNFLYSAQAMNLPTIGRYSHANKSARSKPYNAPAVHGVNDVLMSMTNQKRGSLPRRSLHQSDVAKMQLQHGNYDMAKNMMKSGSYADVEGLQDIYGNTRQANHHYFQNSAMYAGQQQLSESWNMNGNGAPCGMQYQQSVGLPIPQQLHHTFPRNYGNMTFSPDSTGQWSSSPGSEWSDGSGMASPSAGAHINVNNGGLLPPEAYRYTMGTGTLSSEGTNAPVRL